MRCSNPLNSRICFVGAAAPLPSAAPLTWPWSTPDPEPCIPASGRGSGLCTASRPPPPPVCVPTRETKKRKYRPASQCVSAPVRPPRSPSEAGAGPVLCPPAVPEALPVSTARCNPAGPT